MQLVDEAGRIVSERHSGRRLSFDGALELPVVAHEELLPTAMALAQEVASNPPLAIQNMKQGLRLALDPDWTALGGWVSASLGELFATQDHKEGVAAFLEKRDARFEGR